MIRTEIRRRQALAATLLAGGEMLATVSTRATASPALLAPRPPMDLNSWNNFDTTITEVQETAAIMRG